VQIEIQDKPFPIRGLPNCVMRVAATLVNCTYNIKLRNNLYG